MRRANYLLPKAQQGRPQMTSEKSTIESVLDEQRVFEPALDFSRIARIGGMEAYKAMADAARRDPESFWGDAARKELSWFRPFDTVLDWSDAPFAR